MTKNKSVSLHINHQTSEIEVKWRPGLPVGEPRHRVGGSLALHCSRQAGVQRARTGGTRLVRCSVGGWGLGTWSFWGWRNKNQRQGGDGWCSWAQWDSCLQRQRQSSAGGKAGLNLADDVESSPVVEAQEELQVTVPVRHLPAPAGHAHQPPSPQSALCARPCESYYGGGTAAARGVRGVSYRGSHRCGGGRTCSWRAGRRGRHPRRRRRRTTRPPAALV